MTAVTNVKTGVIIVKNIATGETSQAITPYHFFNYFNFFGFSNFFFVWRRDSEFIKGIKPLEYIYGIMSYTVSLYLHFYICAFETMEHHYSYP